MPSIAVGIFAGILAVGIPAFAQKQGPLELSKRVQNARETATTIGDRLRAELSAAVKADGPVNSISFCQTISPELTTNAFDDFGFEASRVGTRLRNPENAPDEWESKILTQFQEQIAAGNDPSKLEHYEVLTTAEGEKLFRFMKPIVMGEMCLTCHGTDIKQDVKAEIARYYPDDKAVGFKVGELRGAFSLAQLIEE